MKNNTVFAIAFALLLWAPLVAKLDLVGGKTNDSPSRRTGFISFNVGLGYSF